MQYMIHACPKRMWYVEEFLLPSLLAQGIQEADVKVWNDDKGEGNLFACFHAFESVDKTGNTFHLQDDVLICSDFKERTEKFEKAGEIVCGFCTRQNDANYFEAFNKPYKLKFMWWSFPCIMIPNSLAREVAHWFWSAAQYYDKYQGFIKGKFQDDRVFLDYLQTKRKWTLVYNLNPNLVEHVDYLIGGSASSRPREVLPVSAYFPEQGLVEDLREAIEKRGGIPS